MTQELCLISKQLVIEKASMEVMKASLVAKSTCLDESLEESVKLCIVLAKTRSQKDKDFVKAWVALGKVEARVAEVEVRIIEAEVRAQMTERLHG